MMAAYFLSKEGVTRGEIFNKTSTVADPGDSWRGRSDFYSHEFCPG